MIERIGSRADDIMAYRISGKLTFDEYKEYEPEWVDNMENQGKTKMLTELVNMKMPELKAFFEDLKLAPTYMHYMTKCAVIGDTAWEKIVVKGFALVMPSKIKYFDHSQEESAWEWLLEDKD